MTLKVYPYGIIRSRQTPTGQEEHPIDLGELAEVLAAKVSLSTGLLSPNTLLVATDGHRRLIAEYRPPSKCTLLFDTAPDSPPTTITAPLPGLILIRRTHRNQRPTYSVYACVRRPTDLNTKLFVPPLPNVYDSGNICWGNVKQVSADALNANQLTEDWQAFLGTRFTGHAVHNKSKREPSDVRLMLSHLQNTKARTYPTSDLRPASVNLKTALDNLR